MDVPGEGSRFSLTRGFIRGDDSSHNVTVNTLTAHKIQLSPKSAYAEFMAESAVENLQVFVNQAAGDDSADGLTSATPVQTLTRAFEVVRENGYNDSCTIEVMSSGGPLQINADLLLDTTTGNLGQQRRAVLLQGSARNEEVSVQTVNTNTATGQGGLHTINVAAGAPFGAPGTQRGRLVRFLTGALADQSFWIADNTSANDLTVNFEDVGSVGGGDMFVIESLTSSIQLATNVSLSIGNPDQKLLQLRDIQFTASPTIVSAILWGTPFVAGSVAYVNNGATQFEIQHVRDSFYGQLGPPELRNLISLGANGNPDAGVLLSGPVRAQSIYSILFAENIVMYQASLAAGESGSVEASYGMAIDCDIESSDTSSLKLESFQLERTGPIPTNVIRASGGIVDLSDIEASSVGAGNAIMRFEEGATVRLGSANMVTDGGYSVEGFNSVITMGDVSLDGNGGSGDGLLLHGCTAMMAAPLTVVDTCADGIWLVGTSLSNQQDSGPVLTSTGNASAGLRAADGCRISLTTQGSAHEFNNNSTGFIIERGSTFAAGTVNANNNGDNGVEILGGSAATFGTLTANTNQTGGIRVRDSSAISSVSSITTTNNVVGTGVQIERGSSCSFNTLNSDGNGGDALAITQSSNFSATGAVIAVNSGSNGVEISSGSTASFNTLTASSNQTNGVFVTLSSSITCSGAITTDNNVTNSGIFLGQGSNGSFSTVDSNGNGTIGIEIEQSSSFTATGAVEGLGNGSFGASLHRNSSFQSVLRPGIAGGPNLDLGTIGATTWITVSGRNPATASDFSVNPTEFCRTVVQ